MGARVIIENQLERDLDTRNRLSMPRQNRVALYLLALAFSIGIMPIGKDVDVVGVRGPVVGPS